MTSRSLILFAAVASVSAAAPVTPVLAAPESDPAVIDEATVRRGLGQGRRQVDATVQVVPPEFYAAREITQEVQTQEWDCPGQRYRVLVRVFRTSGGEFVRSDRKRGGWIGVPEEGALREAYKAICPAEAAAGE